MRLARLSLILSFCLLAGAARAGPEEGAYIGRILVDGRDICSGTLVSPSIVLTAGHCVQPEGGGQPYRIGRVRFLMKSPEDGKRRVYDVRDIGRVPSFNYQDHQNPGFPALRNDIALLKLDGIATRAGHEIIANPVAGGSTTFISARIDENRSPVGSESCLSKVIRNEILVLSCYREEGFSGSPVFAMIGGKRRVIGVVTARSEQGGIPVIYASIPQMKMPDIIWRNDTGRNQIHNIFAPGRSP